MRSEVGLASRNRTRRLRDTAAGKKGKGAWWKNNCLRALQLLFGNGFGIGLALVNFLGRCKDGGPILEDGEGDLFSFTVRDQICVLLATQEIQRGF